MENIEQGTTINIEYEVDGEYLIEKRTPTEIEPNIILHDIKKAQEEITKIDSVIEQWESKKAPHQAIIDKYNEINYGK